MTLVSVIVAAVGAFVLSAVWYGVFGKALVALAPAYGEARPAPLVAVVELARCLVVASVVAVLAGWCDMTGLAQGAGLGLLLWVGFPLPILAGAVFHERTPMRLAAIHLGDWLLKLVLIAAVVTGWR